jgi:hypothetical protein
MRFAFLAFASGAAFVAAVPLACSSSPSALDSFAQQYCAYFMPCCGGSGAAQDPGTCQQTVGSWGTSFGFDPSLTAACLTAMKANTKSTDFCTTLGAAEAPCDAVFNAAPTNGTAPPGGSCTNADDCASVSGSVTVCLPTSSSAAGKGICTQVLPGKAGDAPCYSEQYGGVTSSEGTGPFPSKYYTCHDYDGVYCDFTSHTCEPFVAIGGACDPNGDPCGPNAFCMSAGYGADGGIAWQCTAGLEAGAPCDPSAGAPVALPCDPLTTRCTVEGKCTAFLPSGSPCTTDDECEGACTSGQCATYAESQLCETSAPSFHPTTAPIRPWSRSMERDPR